jgi:hypothetical protein
MADGGEACTIPKLQKKKTEVENDNNWFGFVFGDSKISNFMFGKMI